MIEYHTSEHVTHRVFGIYSKRNTKRVESISNCSNEAFIWYSNFWNWWYEFEKQYQDGIENQRVHRNQHFACVLLLWQTYKCSNDPFKFAIQFRWTNLVQITGILMRIMLVCIQWYAPSFNSLFYFFLTCSLWILVDYICLEFFLRL